MTPGGTAGGALGPVFFLSDYGLTDEFVGVVHAVLAAGAPTVPVVDLSHQVPPFDVSAGARTLARCAPHLGPGVVLAVVDPGVGSARRALILEAVGPGPRFWVGPDNGLLVAGAEGRGALVGAWALGPDAAAGATTFDGRDRFAPAAAALATGSHPAELGRPVDVEGVVRLAPPVVELTGGPGDRTLRAEVLWVDRFGNVQLAVGPDDLSGIDGDGIDGRATDWARASGVAVRVETTLRSAVPAPAGPTHRARRVRSFAELEPGQLGLLTDANGRLALVESAAPAARRLGVAAGSVVRLGPAGPGS